MAMITVMRQNVQYARCSEGWAVRHDPTVLGAFVLDALGPVETTAVKAHLGECAACRAEVAQLRRTVHRLPKRLQDS
ncbi:anti-sigma factor family protein [Nonomuraea sp. NPDC049400]|uniref:anti-sigma factor family protein n=1 Tax=Nonomuraea sp. NPDC049400 TaxID=3364352 RepID=UPI0037A3D80F